MVQQAIISSQKVFDKQAAAGHCRFEGRSPLHPSVFV